MYIVSSGMICGVNWVICVREAGDGSTHTRLSAYDVTKTYVVGDDYQRHRWQCTTSLVSLLKLVKHVHIDRNIILNIEHFQLGLIAVLSGRCHFYDVV